MRYLTFIFVIFLFACNQPEESNLHGYVEGEFVYIAPTTPGNLKDLLVKRGDIVKVGQELFALDETILKSAIEMAEAEKTQAKANFSNITKGKRVDEINVILKQQDFAKAKLENAKKEFERNKNLVEANVITQSEFDSNKTELESSQARVEELSAQLKVASLGAREDELVAAQSFIKLAEQKLIQANQQLQDSRPKVVTAGRIENTFYRQGEFVPAGRPVICLLPPENVKIRFFVSQQLLPKMELGKLVNITFDGGEKPISAKISFIAIQAEYAPPIIYSTESRQKLVYMIEVTPTQPEPALRPGLPVDIRLATQ